MTYTNNDFVTIDFDMYANGMLVQTTSEEKAQEAELKGKEFKPQTIVVGKNFILKALDEDILKAKVNEERSLDLKAEDAFGKRNKEMIRTFKKTAFDEQGLKAVPGVTYDFNGMYGAVKSVSGGRVLVDFNHPLSGRDIKVVYKVTKKVEDIAEKISTIFINVLKMPENVFSVSAKDKTIELKVPEQLMTLEDYLSKSLAEFIPNIKDYSLKIEKFKK